MRLLRIISVGGLTVAIAFALSTADDGTLGAAAFILAVFLALATVGIAAAALAERWFDVSVVNPVLVAQAAAARCSNCGATRRSTAGMWTCPRCDLTPR